jgi:hypothetical protein
MKTTHTSLTSNLINEVGALFERAHVLEKTSLIYPQKPPDP